MSILKYLHARKSSDAHQVESVDKTGKYSRIIYMGSGLTGLIIGSKKEFQFVPLTSMTAELVKLQAGSKLGKYKPNLFRSFSWVCSKSI